MKPYRVSTTARADLDDIWFYIAQDDAEAADKFIRTILVRFPKLAFMPQLGRRRGNCHPDCAAFPSVAMSSFIATWEMRSKSRGSCTA